MVNGAQGNRILPGVPRTKETGTISVLLFFGVEMGTSLSVAEELWSPKDFYERIINTF